MGREVKMNLRQTRDGTFVGISLYDNTGRWVLTARVDRLTEQTAEEIAEFLHSGRLTSLAQKAIRTREL